MVDYKDFIRKITPGDLEAFIVQRAKGRIEKIRENIYDFLISPKDAFRQFNTSRTGKMTFKEFNAFILQLQHLS